MDKKISLSQLVKVVAKIMNAIATMFTEQDKVIAAKVGEAPKDGKAYVRKDAGWVEQAKPASNDEFATDTEVEEAIDAILNAKQ
jgi:hypothetical protein